MKLSNEAVVSLHIALTQMDGWEKEVGDKLVRQPYKFSGKTLMKIARNTQMALAARSAYEDARNNLLLNIAGGDAVIRPEQTDLISKFNQAHAELLASEVDVPFLTMTEEELGLEVNPIPASALSALLPLIQD